MAPINVSGSISGLLIPFTSMGDVDIHVNDMICIYDEWKQYKFPKSKKKRIRRKWSKINSNFRMAKAHRAIMVGGRLMVSSVIYEKIKYSPEI